MTRESLGINQTKTLFFTALIADALIVAYEMDISFTAHEKIWALFINTCLLLLLSVLLFSGTSKKKGGKAYFATAFIALCWGASTAFLDAEKFYRFALNTQYVGALLIALFLGVALYACLCGGAAIARLCSLLLFLFFTAGILLFAINFNNMDVTNLQLAKDSQYGIFTTSVLMFRFPPSLLIICLLGKSDEKTQVKKTIFPGLLLFFAVQAVLILMAELIYGRELKGYSQPIYSLTQTGGLSVFEYLEPFFMCIWLMAILIKGFVLFYSSCAALQSFAEGKRENFYKFTMLIASAILIVAASLLNGKINIAITICLSALSACILSVRGRFNCKKQ